MKKLFGLLVLSLFLFNACSDDDDPTGGEVPEVYDYSEILTDFANNTVVPTYADLKGEGKLLVSDTETFMEDGSQTSLNAACEQWKATRKPWESSEAFIYSVISTYDGLMDSWPLDQSQLDQVLNGGQELTADFVRNGLGSGLRGFHTIEYLLFRDGAPRNVGDITDREKEYLVAVTQVLYEDCVTLWATWAGVEEGTEEAEVLENIEVEIDNPYYDIFVNAGNAGSTYSSQTAAVEEIIQGMIGIADEVANQKIAGPVSSGEALNVESWFSWNSLTDFKNNIRSIKNCYINGYDGSTSGASLSDFVSEKDPTIDTEVKAKIEASITALNNIPEPFRNNLNNDEKTGPAIAAINDLAEYLQSDVLPLFVN